MLKINGNNWDGQISGSKNSSSVFVNFLLWKKNFHSRKIYFPQQEKYFSQQEIREGQC